MPLRPGMPARSTRCSGMASRSFIIGIRLWPPASGAGVLAQACQQRHGHRRPIAAGGRRTTLESRHSSQATRRETRMARARFVGRESSVSRGRRRNNGSFTRRPWRARAAVGAPRTATGMLTQGALSGNERGLLRSGERGLRETSVAQAVIGITEDASLPNPSWVLHVAPLHGLGSRRGARPSRDDKMNYLWSICAMLLGVLSVVIGVLLPALAMVIHLGSVLLSLKRRHPDGAVYGVPAGDCPSILDFTVCGRLRAPCLTP